MKARYGDAVPVHVLRFTVDETRYALPIERIVEVAPRVLVTPLPGAPSFVEGVFSFRQSPCIAISLRRRLGHPARRPALDEHILVVRGRRRLLGLIVDRAHDDAVIDDARIEPAHDHGDSGGGVRPAVSGVIALADGVMLVQDVDAMLSDTEEHAVDAILEGATP